MNEQFAKLRCFLQTKKQQHSIKKRVYWNIGTKALAIDEAHMLN